MTITYAIEIKFNIQGIENYGFGTDNCLYNLQTNRKIKQTYNSRSIGYWIGKKFYSLNKLRPLLYKPKKDYCPF